jgi:hypothetical protein
MHAIVIYRGIQQIYLRVVRKLNVPPKLQVFLLTYQIIRSCTDTRDNMRAKGIPKPLDCELYNEIKKYIKQLLFECIIAWLL